MIQPAKRERITKQEYKEQLAKLRAELLEIQVQLQERKVPVVVLFSGVDGAGKSECANLLNEWMDPRWIVTQGVRRAARRRRAERPRFWRYWRDLPVCADMIGALFARLVPASRSSNRVYRSHRRRPKCGEQLDQICALRDACWPTTARSS